MKAAVVLFAIAAGAFTAAWWWVHQPYEITLAEAAARQRRPS